MLVLGANLTLVHSVTPSRLVTLVIYLDLYALSLLWLEYFAASYDQ